MGERRRDKRDSRGIVDFGALVAEREVGEGRRDICEIFSEKIGQSEVGERGRKG